jgi:hypothetical protein
VRLEKVVAPAVNPVEFEKFTPKGLFANTSPEIFRLPFFYSEPTGVLAAMRRFNRLTLEELGKRINRSRQYAQSLETRFDQNEGTLRTYKNLAAALGYEMVVAFVPKQYAAADPRLSQGVSA